MHAKIIKIDKRKALQMLEKTGLNRNISQGVVERFARDMSAGKFPLTGQTIIVDNKGCVIDGQHRLNAVIQADVELPFLVVFEVPPSAIYNIDTGKPRTPAQVLQLRGFSNTAKLAAVAKAVDMTINGESSGRTLSVDEVCALIDKHHGINWAMKQPGASGTSKFALAPIVGAFAILYGKDKALAEKYWEQFSGGYELNKGDPLLAVRNFLMTTFAKAATMANRRSLTRRCLTAFVYKMRGEKLYRSLDGVEGLSVFCGPKVVKAAEVELSPKKRDSSKGA